MLTNQQQRDEFASDGVTVIRGAFGDGWVQRLRSATDRAMSTRGDQTREYDTNDGGRFFDHLLVKEPGTENPTPWHQDLPFWPVNGGPVCSLWFAMDDVTVDNGGVRYVAGSHTWPQWYRAQSFGGTDKYSDETMPLPPDPDLEPDKYRVVSFDLAPGDVVAHHVMTLHGAPGNLHTKRRRRGLATRWCGDNVVYDPRPKTMPLPDGHGLTAGEPIISPMFPRIFTAV
jgi:ectoine hydroxylase-related dioxygenase (phytanoyl-CoA dioxygenase family)